MNLLICSFVIKILLVTPIIDKSIDNISSFE